MSGHRGFIQTTEAIQMQSNLLRGAVAGAVGTVTLNVVTYADMTLRGRASSTTPATLAGKLTDALGISLAEGSGDEAKETAENRKSGLGALFGYVTGLGVGMIYGVSARGSDRSLMARGVGVGLAAMAASDIPTIASGTSDPTTWGVSGWLADVIPHIAYGLATVLTLKMFERSQE